jgi:hypothetical protein
MIRDKIYSFPYSKGEKDILITLDFAVFFPLVIVGCKVK